MFGELNWAVICEPALYHILLRACPGGGEWAAGGPATGGWSDTERLNMVQPRTLSKGRAVKK